MFLSCQCHMNHHPSCRELHSCRRRWFNKVSFLLFSWWPRSCRCVWSRQHRKKGDCMHKRCQLNKFGHRWEWLKLLTSHPSILQSLRPSTFFIHQCSF
jgi:hypothetical protein